MLNTSLELGIRLFQTAKKMEMTGDGYLWIATNQITDHFHSINPTTISSLKGIVGVKSYFPEDKPDFLYFRKRFRHKFHSDYPEEDQDEPGIFAVQGYNSVKFLEENTPEWKPIPETVVEIVYVIGKGYHSAYWTEESGFSETVDNDINELNTINGIQKLLEWNNALLEVISKVELVDLMDVRMRNEGERVGV
ncbi:glutamate receptor 2.8-like protein [Tanacetum coccineum]|uniref:Glutamate receptor 2.8-like protein n=1 Tax=Tanacetum coccineum TaxID=301880 RepID=A0ABQ4XLZ0_9ASTR